MWSLGVLFYIICLRLFIRALVGNDIFGFFCFLVCFAMLIALCLIISVMFLFRLSMSSCSSSAVNPQGHETGAGGQLTPQNSGRYTTFIRAKDSTFVCLTVSPRTEQVSIYLRYISGGVTKDTLIGY